MKSHGVQIKNDVHHISFQVTLQTRNSTIHMGSSLWRKPLLAITIRHGRELQYQCLLWSVYMAINNSIKRNTFFLRVLLSSLHDVFFFPIYDSCRLLYNMKSGTSVTLILRNYVYLNNLYSTVIIKSNTKTLY